MNIKLKNSINHEINSGKLAIKNNKLGEAFNFFERAHVLGQKDPYYHTLSHVLMLRIALIQMDVWEIIGQLIRIPSGFIGSVIGIVPTGNTGGANISLFKEVPIPKDLQRIIDSDI